MQDIIAFVQDLGNTAMKNGKYLPDLRDIERWDGLLEPLRARHDICTKVVMKLLRHRPQPRDFHREDWNLDNLGEERVMFHQLLLEAQWNPYWFERPIRKRGAYPDPRALLKPRKIEKSSLPGPDDMDVDTMERQFPLQRKARGDIWSRADCIMSKDSGGWNAEVYRKRYEAVCATTFEERYGWKLL
jgi:hypothetical protein